MPTTTYVMMVALVLFAAAGTVAVAEAFGSPFVWIALPALVLSLAIRRWSR